MSFESKTPQGRKLRFSMLAIVMLYALAGMRVNADQVKVNLRVCVQDAEGSPVKSAKVVMKGANNPPTLTETQEQGCYSNNNVSLNNTKSYSLHIEAEGYVATDVPLDFAKLQQNGTLSPDGKVILTKTAGQVVGDKASVGDSAGDAASKPPVATPSQSPVVTAVSNGWWSMVLIALGVNLLFVLVGGTLLALKGKQKRGTAPRSPISGGAEYPLPNTVLESLVVSLQGIKEEQEKQTQLLGEFFSKFPAGNLGSLGEGKEEKPEGKRRKTPADRRPLRDTSSAMVKQEESLTQTLDEELVRSSYINFLRGSRVSPEPLFLSAEGGSSPEDMLGRKQAVLEENPQGAIVLFRNPKGEDDGWVYPNTNVHYREEALKKVFPYLTEDQFKFLKQSKSLEGSNVEPVPVKKFDTSRWQVASI